MSSASQLQFPAPAGQPDPPSLSGGSRSQAGTSYPLLSALTCFCKAVCCPRDLLENSADPGVELDPKNGAYPSGTDRGLLEGGPCGASYRPLALPRGGALG